MDGLLIVAYVIGMLGNIWAAGIIHEEYGNTKLAARVGLLTLVWPVSAVIGLYALVGLLWKNAELDLGKVKK